MDNKQIDGLLKNLPDCIIRVNKNRLASYLRSMTTNIIELHINTKNKKTISLKSPYEYMVIKTEE